MRVRKYAAIGIAQIVSLGISWVFVTYVFVGPTPYIQAELPQKIAQLPSNSVSLVKHSLEGRSVILGLAPITPKIGSNPPVVATDNGQPPAESEVPSSEVAPTVSMLQPTVTPYVPPGDPVNTPVPTQKWRLPLPEEKPTATQNNPLPTSVPTQPANRPQPTVGSGSGASVTAQEQETVRLINQRRAASGLRQLSTQSQLTLASREWSASLASSGKCGHDPNGMSATAARAKKYGYSGRVFGETVGCKHPTAKSVVDGWWSSPPHKYILANPNVTQIGVGWHGTHQTAMVGY